MATGGPSLSRWAVVGMLLLATASFKGPQPAAFFALGVGAFILLNRDWRQVPGYCLAGLISLGGLAGWYLSVLRSSDLGMVAGYMRFGLPGDPAFYLAERFAFASILVQFLPATLVLLPAAPGLVRRRDGAELGANRGLATALALYGGLALIPLALWPGAQPRYAMSALLPAACLAGLVFDETLRRRLDLARLAIGVLVGLVAYQLAWGWLIAPAFSRDFAASRIAADTIEAVALDRGMPIVAPVRSADAILAYLDRPISYLTEDQIDVVAAPVYLVGPPATVNRLAARRPDLDVAPRARLHGGLVLYEIVSRPGS